MLNNTLSLRNTVYSKWAWVPGRQNVTNIVRETAPLDMKIWLLFLLLPHPVMKSRSYNFTGPIYSNVKARGGEVFTKGSGLQTISVYLLSKHNFK